MEGIKKHYLDSKQTLSYFMENIKCEKTLSQKIVKNIDFHNGMFFTFLPSAALLDRLYELPYGGILPSFPLDDQGNQYTQTMCGELTTFIKSHLKEKTSSYAIVENYMLTPDSSHAYIKNVKMTPYKEEVYYFLTDKNSKNEVSLTIRKSSEVWHFLCVLTKLENKHFVELREEEINLIIKNLDYVITNAYDGESYIFWERQHRSHLG